MFFCGSKFENETITLTRPTEGVSISDCIFYNCHFKINKPTFVFLAGNKYHNCTFEFDFTSCKDDIEICYDEIIDYPEVKEYLDKVIPSKCPKNKDFYGYKILYNEHQGRHYLAKLLINAGTPTANNGVIDKSRAEKAKVISIYNITDGLKQCKSVYNKCFCTNGQNMDYTVGHTVYANKWDSNRFNICTNGIHFYLNPITALRIQWGCGKRKAEEIISTLNKVEPDFYSIEEEKVDE